MRSIYVSRLDDCRISVRIYAGISKHKTRLFPDRDGAVAFAESKMGRNGMVLDRTLMTAEQLEAHKAREAKADVARYEGWPVTEIGVSFLRDAYNKVGEPINHSALKPRDRLVLAFKSYGELILNFAIPFALCPTSCWMAGASVPPSPGSLTDVLFFQCHDDHHQRQWSDATHTRIVPIFSRFSVGSFSWSSASRSIPVWGRVDVPPAGGPARRGRLFPAADPLVTRAAPIVASPAGVTYERTA